MALAWLGLVIGMALFASPSQEPDLSGTWAGGTNLMGRWMYVQARMSRDGGQWRGTLEVPSAQAAGIPVEGIRVEGGGQLRFTVRTPLGDFRFEGRLGDGQLEGRITGEALRGELHLMRTAVPAPEQGAAAVGNYDLGGGQSLVVTHRPFGELWLAVLERSAEREGEVVRRAMYAVPVGPDRYLTSGSIVAALRRDETLTLERDAAGLVTAIAWSPPGGATRVARRVPGLVQQAVSFAGPAGRLAGTLFLPQGAGPHPAVVLVSGSGPVTRDNTAIRAREFARIGVAALTWDKRGVGESAGDYYRASLDDLAGDAAAALGYLASRGDLDAARLGISGHSQGAWIAPLAAVRAAVPPRWLVVTSGGPIHPALQEAWRAATQVRGAGLGDQAARDAEVFMRAKWRFALGGGDWNGYLEAARRAQAAQWGRFVAPLLSDDSAAWAFMRGTREFDPMAAPSRLTLPLLVVFGERDDEQPVDSSVAAWREVFQRSGHADHELVTIPGAPHSLWLQGDPAAIVSQPTDVIRRWLVAHRVVAR